MASSGTLNPIESSFQLLNLTSSTTISGSRAETTGSTGGVWEIIEWLPVYAPTIDFISVDDAALPTGEIMLSAGSTKFVNCTVIASDSRGASNIVNASATLYYYLNKSSDPDHNTVHYTNTSCDAVDSNSTSKTFLCAFNVYYYANNGTWNCNATVYNGVPLSASANASATILPLYALNITDGLEFGNVEPNIESSEIIANITNLGNMPINLTLQGYAVFIGDVAGMNCSDGTNISIGRIKYSLATASYVAKNSLTGGLQQLTLTMPKPTSLAPVVNTTYWQIMPDPYIGSIARYCSGHVIFSAESS
jgi:hypothetical protein